MGVLPNLFKLWPWVDFDPFYAKVKFGHEGFCMGKRENYLFFENYYSLGSQSCLKHLAKWVNEVEWVSKVKVILWPWSKITQISKFKLVFLKNSWAIWNQSSYESLKENRNENIYGSLPKTSNTLNIRTPYIIAKYNFKMFPKISNSG